MGFTCYCINLRIIASFLRLTMGSLFSVSVGFAKIMEHGIFFFFFFNRFVDIDSKK